MIAVWVAVVRGWAAMRARALVGAGQGWVDAWI